LSAERTPGTLYAVSSVQDADVAAVARVSAVPTILRVIAETTGLRLALVARVTEDTWKACAVLDRMSFGLEPGGLLDVATTLCSEVRDAKAPVVIDCASEDPTYCAHPTPKMYGFESYISVPIFLRNGDYFGNVCALDARPVALQHGATVAMFQLFAELIGTQLEAEERQHTTEEALLDARSTAELREQFIAVLGHDIRTPLSAIVSGTGLLLKRIPEGAEQQIVRRIRASASRISRLVDDVLDFARGRLGGGIPLELHEVSGLEGAFAQVVEEARANFPARTIRFQATSCPSLRCDRDRLAQVLANLLGNALQHSPADSSVDVDVRCDGGGLLLLVTNRGQPIPDAARAQLFQPFVKGSEQHPRAGLGLGLYIVSQIVASHGGQVEVRSSTEEGTTFAVRIPAA
jgi:phosphoserine phosphatase RsbU/P